MLESKRSEGKEEFAAMTYEVFMVQDEHSWWIDSDTTRHICKGKACFKTYAAVEDGIFLYMGKFSKEQVRGKGSVILEFTSRKFLTLNDVYHVLNIQKNLVPGSLLDRFGLRVIYEANKVVISKGGVFFGKGYVFDGMFKLSINNTNNVATYIYNSFSLWHNRLGHVNFRRMNDMMKLDLILYVNKSDNNVKSSC